ncbi:class I SAM-dependent methyltransferase [Rubritalea spongiae]|uniref:Class I SAM-dependent methyltransferase n=1 Tax=Rubritalea spongiae TaxID=430797 RepID=A0ABW5E303_9BACT
MLLRPLEMAQEMVRGAVLAGETVVDATLGNGHDALFLAGLVGAGGRVIGFDVQTEAIESSQRKVEAAGVAADVFSFYCVGHEYLSDYVEGPVAAVMFNLGYLPRADKAVITTVETTLPALEQALSLLRVKGVLSIMCYPGHEGGEAEAEAVVQWASELTREQARVMRYGMVNAPNSPAFLIAIEKVR